MDEKYEIKGISFILVALAIALCTFMQSLDLSIANVAVPYMAGDLGVSVSSGTWVITFFMVGNAIVLPISGWLAEKVGSIRLIIVSSILFGVVSFLCGISVNFPMLIVSRFFQGAAAGPLIPTSQVLLMKVFPKGKENMALALWAMVLLVGPISGPIVGGWITETYSWRWIFLINIPVVLFSSIVLIGQMKNYLTAIIKMKFDWWGLIFLVVGITSLQIFLDQGRQLDWFHSSTIKTLFYTAVISLTLLVVHEWNCEKPLIDIRLFKISSFAIGTIVLSLSFMTFFAPIVITPLWLEGVMGYTSFKAGICLSSMGILPFIFAPLVGKAMGSGRLKLLVGTSLILMAIVSYFYTKFNTDATMFQVALSRFCFGFGMVFYVAPATALPLVQIPANKISNASGILQFFRIFMSGAGTAIYTTIWNNRATFHHQALGSNLTRFNENIVQFKTLVMEKFGFNLAQYYSSLNSMLDNQAYMLATNDVMLLSAVSLLLLFILLYFVRVTPKECRQANATSTS